LRLQGEEVIGGEDSGAQAAQHIPVMLKEALAALSIRANGRYCDGTFGRGGHSRAILDRLNSEGSLLAIDRDAQAIQEGGSFFDETKPNSARLDLVHDRFSNLPAILDRLGIKQLDGVLFDLGVSSPQLDEAERGFSFMRDGPLDMRMDPSSGEPAWQWLERVDEQELTKVISSYGEERFARAVAKAIVARREDDTRPALRTTKQLADLVARVIGRRGSRAAVAKNPATRTFQAIRLFVNQELEELSLVLSHAVDALAPGGRLAVISFHSLEDRIVKEFMARESGRRAAKDPVTGASVHEHAPRLDMVKRTLAGAGEIQSNVRARSAVLRSARRTTGSEELA